MFRSTAAPLVMLSLDSFANRHKATGGGNARERSQIRCKLGAVGSAHMDESDLFPIGRKSEFTILVVLIQAKEL